MAFRQTRTVATTTGDYVQEGNRFMRLSAMGTHHRWSPLTELEVSDRKSSTGTDAASTLTWLDTNYPAGTTGTAIWIVAAADRDRIYESDSITWTLIPDPSDGFPARLALNEGVAYPPTANNSGDRIFWNAATNRWGPIIASPLEEAVEYGLHATTDFTTLAADAHEVGDLLKASDGRVYRLEALPANVQDNWAIADASRPRIYANDADRLARAGWSPEANEVVVIEDSNLMYKAGADPTDPAQDEIVGGQPSIPIIQPRLITYNNPALTQDNLVYGDIVTVDLMGTTTTDRLTLNLPGTETSDRVMEITIQDIPSVSFDNGFLNIVAQPNGATPVQILTPNGISSDSAAQVSRHDLKGSEISLVRATGANAWIMRSQLPGHTSDVWTGRTGAINAPNPEFYKVWIHSDTTPPKVQFYSPGEAIWRDA